jgi:hypothetical protein
VPRQVVRNWGVCVWVVSLFIFWVVKRICVSLCVVYFMLYWLFILLIIIKNNV